MSGVGFAAKHGSVYDVLSTARHLQVPAYQRSYAWTEADAEALLSDVDAALQAGTGHFLGAVVFARQLASTAMPDTGFDVVDGQQRLTTLTIMLCVLRDLEPDPELANALHALIEAPADPIMGLPAGFRLHLNRFDAAFFREEIQRLGATRFLQNDAPTGADSRTLLVDVALILRDALSQRNVEERRGFARHLLAYCGVVIVEAQDADAGFNIFRVLNARGRPLENYDLIKGELFQAAALTAQEAEAYARDWSGYAASLGLRRFGEMLQHMRVIHDRTLRGDLVAGFRAGVLRAAPARVVLDEWLPAHVEANLAISEGRIEAGRQTAAVNALVSSLGMLDNSSWRTAAVQFLVLRPDDVDAMRDFFEELERLMFVLRLIGLDRPKRLQRLRTILDSIDRDDDLFRPGGALSLLPGEANLAFRRLSSRLTNFPLRRALTFRANAALKQGEVLSPDADATVEHVLPLSPKPGSDWLIEWPDPHERRDLCNTLGNLVLLSHAQNQEADRAPYAEKRQIFFANGTAEFALTRDIAGCQTWTPDIVRARTERLAGLLAHIWHLDRG